MNLTAIFVPAIVFFTIYKIIEVLTHRKERLVISDKLEKLNNLNDSNLPGRLRNHKKITYFIFLFCTRFLS